MNKTNKYLLAPIGLLSLTALSGAILMSCNVNADNDSVVDQVSITVPISCTLSGSGMTSHNASIPNGTYTDNIGTTTLKVFCNDNSGFAIYAVGYTGNEIGVTNSTKLVGTSASNNATIDTGTATGPVSGNDTSNWAMKLQTVSSPTPTYPITIDNSFSNYTAVPSSYTKVAHRDNGTDIGQNAEGSTLTTTYAAYISKTQAADTYSGQVKYTLVHPADADPPLSPVPCVAGNICYQPNASDAVGTMGNQSATDGSSVTLYASNFSRSGYGFAGWSDAYDYATNPNANFYGPNATFTVPTGTTANGLSLYAVWVKSTGSLQTDATTACNGLTQDPNDGTADLSSVTALTDERDNNTYAIAKLADNKCWMIENLRLENTASHNSDGTLAQGYNSSFIGLADPESANFTDSTTVNSLYSTDGSTAAPAITGSFTNYRFPRYNNNNTSSRQSSSSYSTSGNTYSYGNYYTWHAAIADTTYYSSGNHNTTSICPAGWHIPTGKDATGEFGLLDIALGGTGSTSGSSTTPTGAVMSSRYRSYPNNFLNSGYFEVASVTNRGAYGHYWSSTASSNGGSYRLYLDSSTVFPGNGIDNKFLGRTIRCTLGS